MPKFGELRPASQQFERATSWNAYWPAQHVVTPGISTTNGRPAGLKDLVCQVVHRVAVLASAVAMCADGSGGPQTGVLARVRARPPVLPIHIPAHMPAQERPHLARTSRFKAKCLQSFKLPIAGDSGVLAASYLFRCLPTAAPPWCTPAAARGRHYAASGSAQRRRPLLPTEPPG